MHEPPVALAEWHLLNTGFASGAERILLRGGSGRQIRLPMTFSLLRHPVQGWGLFDTGYAPRSHDAAARWPFTIYSRIVPASPSPEGAAVNQLKRFELAATDIRWIVVSHFHSDHVAGLHDFPGAHLYTTRSGYEYASSLHGWRALRRGVLPDLLPTDFAARATLVDDFVGESVAPFGQAHDLFGDGSVRLIALPGHARGQIGALIRTARGEVFLSADACWLSQAIRENRPPHPIVAVFVDDRRAVNETIALLHAFAAAHPEVDIVPTHCPEAYARWRDQ